MTLASSPPLDVSKCPGTKCIFFVSVSAGIRRKLRSLSLKGCMPSTYAPDVLTRAMRQSFRSRRRGVYGIQLRDSSSIALYLSLYLLQLIEQSRVLGLIADRMDVDVTDLSLLIDDEQRSFSKPFRAKHTVFQCG